MKSSSEKKLPKKDRERLVLFALVEYYIRVGKPVGSTTLKEEGFPDLSPATIRNYFASLEKKGFLHQQHTSGGRVPTNVAYKLYAEHVLQEQTFQEDESITTASDDVRDEEHIMLYLQKSAQQLSELTSCPAFLSAPRFDTDYVIECKLVSIDKKRILSVLITHFGLVYTEVVNIPQQLDSEELKRISDYFSQRIMKRPIETNLTKEELHLANHLYQEIMARYFVTYANFSQEDIYRTGFSEMLRYPEFQEAQALSASLLLFEDVQRLRFLARNVMKHDGIKFWIGDDLQPNANCALIAGSYQIAQSRIGAVGVIAPMRTDYKKIFDKIHQVQKEISLFLTRVLYTFKVSYRGPKMRFEEIDTQQEFLLLENTSLLEKRE